ncbi:sulfatase [Carboxylicivirga sp. M1479]|uniref:sulfatase family protein n=1 Tax=Carboxylicivirga sp. M1479 TaxID=2594476 RepID=UPI001C8F7EB2|nr:sulfatase [Carboxylicivirga sp. M1479]
MNIRNIVCVIMIFAWMNLHGSSKPNIIWIMAEDISTELSCYGHSAVKTPVLDHLSSLGTKYTNAFTTAPSCTPSRNAMLTGVYQTSTDTQDQRRGGVTLPGGIVAFTELLREAGYYTALGCGYHDKTDHNFIAEKYYNEDKKHTSYLFDGNDWKYRAEGQPFFAQITLPITHRWYSSEWPKLRELSENPVDTAEIELPPYFPRHDITLNDWALYLGAIEKMDSQVGEILMRLEEEGITDNTIVIFIGDNGRCHLRGKCWLYDAGINIPLIIKWPEEEGNIETDKLVSMLDVTATILDVSGAELPDYLDGRSLLDSSAPEREYVFAARDVIGNVEDHIRCVRTKQFKYIRNYVPEIGYQECQYVLDNRPMLPIIEDLGTQNKLNNHQKLILAKPKPFEELYQIHTDPNELNNLATKPEYQETLKKLSRVMDNWIEETRDKGMVNF